MSPMGYYITQYRDRLDFRYISDTSWTSLSWLIDVHGEYGGGEICCLDENYRTMLF